MNSNNHVTSHLWDHNSLVIAYLVKLWLFIRAVIFFNVKSDWMLDWFPRICVHCWDVSRMKTSALLQKIFSCLFVINAIFCDAELRLRKALIVWKLRSLCSCTWMSNLPRYLLWERLDRNKELHKYCSQPFQFHYFTSSNRNSYLCNYTFGCLKRTARIASMVLRRSWS